jgi:ribonuclease PH
VEYGVLKSLPIRDYLAAVSVGIVDGQALLDLCYEEDSRAAVDMNVVMTGRGEFVELQATAEQMAFHDDHLLQMLELARKGIREVFDAQRAFVQLQP